MDRELFQVLAHASLLLRVAFLHLRHGSTLGGGRTIFSLGFGDAPYGEDDDDDTRRRRLGLEFRRRLVPDEADLLDGVREDRRGIVVNSFCPPRVATEKKNPGPIFY